MFHKKYAELRCIIYRQPLSDPSAPTLLDFCNCKQIGSGRFQIFSLGEQSDLVNYFLKWTKNCQEEKAPLVLRALLEKSLYICIKPCCRPAVSPESLL